MLVYLQFVESRRVSRYLLALGLFALALLSKTVTVTLPVALLIIFWWQRGTVCWRRDVLPLIPFFALGAASGVVTIFVERTYFRAEDAALVLAPVQRLLVAGRAVWFYVGTLVWPANLVFTYPRWNIDPAEWWQWIFPAAAAAMTIVLWMLRKRWRAPLAGWLFFCGTLFPVLGFFKVYMFNFTFVADHLLYLASLGMIVPAAAGIAVGLARLPPPARRPAVAICAVLVGIFAALTMRQSRLYGNVIALYQETIDRNPESWMIHNNLGVVLEANGNREGASEHYQTALRINPTDAKLHYNLANLLIQSGQAGAALDDLHKALALKPDYFPARNALGLALVQLNRLPEAVREFEYAVQLRPDFAVIRTNLGAALAKSGRTSEAMEQYRQVLQIDPNQPTAHYNLGQLLAGNGKLEAAIAHFQESLRLQPGFAQAEFSLAQSLARLNRNLEAEAAAQHASAIARSGGQQALAEEIEAWLSRN
jgi:tetratricopeptide (TPR) repeat protein